MRITFSNTLKKTGAVVVLHTGKKELIAPFKDLNKVIKELYLKGEVAEKTTTIDTCGFSKVHIVGAGAETDKQDLREIGAYIVSASGKDKNVQVDVDGLASKEIAQIAYGVVLGSYKFDKYKTVKKDKSILTEVSFVGKNVNDAKKCFTNLNAIADGVILARDLVSEPANTLTPLQFVKTAETLKKFGVKVKILKKKELEKLGMAALLGVAQGSVNEPYVAVMEYMNDKKSDNPFVFVGKGVTFDSGGISIKPSAGMEDMKFDMGGAAAVVGALRAISGRKAKANVVGIIGLVENMPDGNAQRPGDVVTSMDGQTIEIINTDAEGRLVLADCLTYAQSKYKPHALVNLATLTGAMIVALGYEYAGVFSNDDVLANNILDAGDSEFEGLWPMPMNKNFDKDMNSAIADMRNSGSRWGGACTAAAFLRRFVSDKVSWAHIDIAGTAWEYKGKPTCPKGATGFGVKTLDRMVFDFERNYKK